MERKLLHDPAKGTLRAVAFMSGSGTNLCRVLEHEQTVKKTRGNSPFHICGIFSDTCNSSAALIGKEYNLPVVIRDIKAFYQAYDKPRSNLGVREIFDRETVHLLSPLGAQFAVYAGYMSIASSVLIAAFTGVNVHPADLSVTEGGKRKWVGMHTVRDALAAGEKVLRATTHLVEPVVDGGRILMLSPQVTVKLPEHTDLSDKNQLKQAADLNQSRLKEMGDWIILPKTIEYIADGRYSVDETGMLYFDEEPVPQGVKLE